MFEMHSLSKTEKIKLIISTLITCRLLFQVEYLIVYLNHELLLRVYGCKCNYFCLFKLKINAQ